jgi:hypothetical protein
MREDVDHEKSLALAVRVPLVFQFGTGLTNLLDIQTE